MDISNYFFKRGFVCYIYGVDFDDGVSRLYSFKLFEIDFGGMIG